MGLPVANALAVFTSTLGTPMLTSTPSNKTFVAGLPGWFGPISGTVSPIDLTGLLVYTPVTFTIMPTAIVLNELGKFAIRLGDSVVSSIGTITNTTSNVKSPYTVTITVSNAGQTKILSN